MFPKQYDFARSLVPWLHPITRITTNRQTARGCHEPKVASAAAVGADISWHSLPSIPLIPARTFIPCWLTLAEDNAISVANKHPKSSSFNFAPHSELRFVGGWDACQGGEEAWGMAGYPGISRGLHMCARQVMRYKKFKKLLPEPAPKTTILTSISQIKILSRVTPPLHILCCLPRVVIVIVLNVSFLVQASPFLPHFLLVSSSWCPKELSEKQCAK